MKFQVVHDFGQTPRIQAMHLDPCQVASVTGSQPPTWLDIGHAFALAIRASQKTAPASRFPLSSWCHLLVRSRMQVGPHASQNHWGEDNFRRQILTTARPCACSLLVQSPQITHATPSAIRKVMPIPCAMIFAHILPPWECYLERFCSVIKFCCP